MLLVSPSGKSGSIKLLRRLLSCEGGFMDVRLHLALCLMDTLLTSNSNCGKKQSLHRWRRDFISCTEWHNHFRLLLAQQLSITFVHTDDTLATSLEVIDLSNDWTNSTLQIQSIPKLSGVPDLVKAGLWYDPAADTLYSGFAGRSSYIGNETGQIPDYPLGVWQYGPVNSGSATFRPTIASTDALWDTLIRPCSGLITYTGSKGYVIGGADALDVRDDYTPAIDGILEFDFRTKTLMNVTIQGTLFDAGIHTAGVLFIPAFGSQGIIIVIGGEDAAINLVPMDSVSIMDVASGQWYIQKVGGTIPRPRKSQCIAGAMSQEGSFEM